MTTPISKLMRAWHRDMRADANKLRGLAASLRALGDDEVARQIDGIAERMRGRSFRAHELAASEDDTCPGIFPPQALKPIGDDGRI